MQNLQVTHKIMSEPNVEWLLMVDGAARGNPGDAGCCAVILNHNGIVVRELSRYLGRATKDIVVQSDSQLSWCSS